ncbi:hypothetical protein VRB21_08905 [Pseudomonas poae]
MSVSTTDPSVSTSSFHGHSHANTRPDEAAQRSSPAASPVNGQKTANVSFHFHQDHAGPVFGQPQTTAPHQHQHAEPQRPAPSMWGLLAMVNNLMSLLGFARPPMLTGLSTKSNEQLAQMLLNNFDAFRDPKRPNYVSLDSIRTMAKKRGPAIRSRTRTSSWPERCSSARRS